MNPCFVEGCSEIFFMKASSAASLVNMRQGQSSPGHSRTTFSLGVAVGLLFSSPTFYVVGSNSLISAMDLVTYGLILMVAVAFPQWWLHLYHLPWDTESIAWANLQL